MKSYVVDLHIHIGRTENDQPVKISASRNLTFRNIASEAAERKGIELIGIIDCHSPIVQDEIMHYLDKGEMSEVAGGGIHYKETTILLGSEIEVKDPGRGPAHLLAYMPNLDTMRRFSAWMARHVKNMTLSSQRIYVPARELQHQVAAHGGFMIAAHVFTPHKSVYGSSAARLSELLDPQPLAALELGLSSDTSMASLISETDSYPFVSNSDAHSLAKLGREYNVMMMEEPSFLEVRQALAGSEGRRIVANYGLDPRLGKYHRSYCAACHSIIDEKQIAADRCLYCGHTRLVRGVMDRIMEIGDRSVPCVSPNRPPYRYQIPLEFIPGLGGRMLQRLLEQFGTEMNIIHRATFEELVPIAGEPIARMIMQARSGELAVKTGGGGTYGKVRRT